YTISGLPTGLTFNAATRTLSGKPTIAGSYVVKLKATDVFNAVTEIEIKLTVEPNTKPSIPDFSAPMAFKSKLYSFTFPAATDIDGNPITYYLDSEILSRGMSFNNETRTITGITEATGEFTCKYAAFDGIERTEKQFILLVDPNTAVQTTEFETIKLYPNPTTDFIIVEGIEIINSIEIYSITGKLVGRKIVNHENSATVDVSIFPTGNYIIKTITTNKSYVQQFIKQ
ncbi:MAG TPA: hypothetical protein DCQ31_10795, partial [Bacteroidales bacterium]|nr:hypothetical protein [Bacteroidales bacterium]